MHINIKLATNIWMVVYTGTEWHYSLTIFIMIFAWHYGKHKKPHGITITKSTLQRQYKSVTFLVGLFEWNGKHFCAEQEKDPFISILSFIFLFIYTFLLLIQTHMQICNLMW